MKDWKERMQGLCQEEGIVLHLDCDIWDMMLHVGHSDTDVATIQTTTYKEHSRLPDITIAVGRDVEDAEVCSWHELGHHKHPLGTNANGPNLTKELAANAWVFAHYEGDKTIEEIISILRPYIMTYVEGGCITALSTPELKATAEALGIYHLVKWI